MAADGQLLADVADYQGRHSEPATALASYLDTLR
jgi:hypothetical protein